MESIIGGTFYGAVTNSERDSMGLEEDWKHQRRHILRSNRK